MAPLLITMNSDGKLRQEKFITGRCVVLKVENCPYVVGAITNFNVLIHK